MTLTAKRVDAALDLLARCTKMGPDPKKPTRGAIAAVLGARLRFDMIDQRW